MRSYIRDQARYLILVTTLLILLIHMYGQTETQAENVDIRLDIQLEYLTCLPNLDKDPKHVEEVEMFYSEPEYLISSKYSSYDCLIMFDSLLKRLKNGTEKNVLDKLGFKDTQTFFHTHFMW